MKTREDIQKLIGKIDYIRQKEYLGQEDIWHLDAVISTLIWVLKEGDSPISEYLDEN